MPTARSSSSPASSRCSSSSRRPPSPSSRPRRSGSSTSAGPAPRRATSPSTTSSTRTATTTAMAKPRTRPATCGRSTSRVAPPPHGQEQTMSDQSAQGTGEPAEPEALDDRDDLGGGDEQIAFDINDFPGGARSALEAALMVIDEVEDLGESGAMLYRTTPYFLQRMGLSSLDDLPALAPYLPDADVIDELIEEGHA